VSSFRLLQSCHLKTLRQMRLSYSPHRPSSRECYRSPTASLIYDDAPVPFRQFPPAAWEAVGGLAVDTVMRSGCFWLLFLTVPTLL
jgi:hypothetical protein